MARDFLVGDGMPAGVFDSLEDFHPCDTPRGMLYYNMDVLTDEQQKKLNDLKRRTVVDDEKYLAKHPQVRACVAIMIREVLRERPRGNIHDTIARYFAQPRNTIEADISSYINSRKTTAREGDSQVDLLTPATSLISPLDSMDKVTQTMSLDITRSFRALGTHASDQTKGSPYKKISMEPELPGDKITELFIKNILSEGVDARIYSRDILDVEEVLRIESYRHFRDLLDVERSKSHESAGFVASEIPKAEEGGGEVQEIFGELFQEDASEEGDEGRNEVEVEEIREVLVSILESVEVTDIGTEIERDVEENHEEEATVDDVQIIENLDN